MSVPLQIGTVVHMCISTLLKRLLKEPDRPVASQRFSEYARRKVAEQHSRARYAEIHYGEKEEVDTEELSNNVIAALINLIESERFQWLSRQAATATIPWVIDPDGFGETRVEGLKAYCKVDFLIPTREHLHIIDWKTGKEREEKHISQMRGYAAWAAYHYDFLLDDITTTIAYLLPEYKEATVELNEYDMQDFATLVREQSREMQALCSDVSENIPLPKDKFPLTQIESICEYCNFRKLCDRV